MSALSHARKRRRPVSIPLSSSEVVVAEVAARSEEEAEELRLAVRRRVNEVEGEREEALRYAKGLKEENRDLEGMFNEAVERNAAAVQVVAAREEEIMCLKMVVEELEERGVREGEICDDLEGQLAQAVEVVGARDVEISGMKEHIGELEELNGRLVAEKEEKVEEAKRWAHNWSVMKTRLESRLRKGYEDDMAKRDRVYVSMVRDMCSKLRQKLSRSVSENTALIDNVMVELGEKNVALEASREREIQLKEENKLLKYDVHLLNEEARTTIQRISFEVPSPLKFEGGN
ncbi:hypothetical protein TrRE_jg2170 [Triparma retinervis]|uniref:Uncharacterized protein n=1 Tax=Triparma retinervis TaxID=2557542 RepID=A0A9W7FWZ4_9STRA|nr:hypothetical protein TrRE_jg2170 [Triparma retinervis]